MANYNTWYTGQYNLSVNTEYLLVIFTPWLSDGTFHDTYFSIIFIHLDYPRSLGGNET
jgi:hypothetical protein